MPLLRKIDKTGVTRYSKPRPGTQRLCLSKTLSPSDYVSWQTPLSLTMSCLLFLNGISCLSEGHHWIDQSERWRKLTLLDLGLDLSAELK
jgi:hypothetical protein